jgi:DNA-3-methyladenine glycosylase I
MKRCEWCGDDPLYVDYHDREWGVPVYDDRQLLEKLILDGAQAGLSWITILRKKENYRKAFDRFDPERMARYDSQKIAALLRDPGIVRNRLKIMAAVANARAYLAVREQRGSFARYLWQFVDGRPIQNRWKTLAQLPCESRESELLSRQLKRDGFRFVGPTICYAFMQAVGMVNDHVTGCFRHHQVRDLARTQAGRLVSPVGPAFPPKADPPLAERRPSNCCGRRKVGPT